jgi:hypothetical protein
LTTERCEACRQAPATEAVPENDGEPPYRVCAPCARRLFAFSLRPLEWFNLAAVHGPSRFQLHDDFYWEGQADQAEEPVEHPERYPLPSLDQVREDLDRLLDYAMTRFSLMEEAEVLEAVRRHPPAAVVDNLARRVAAGAGLHVIGAACELCGWAVGPPAATWVRQRWSHYRPELLSALAVASAGCLPFEEGWGRVTEKLRGRTGVELKQESFALAWFRSPAALDWIEENAALASYESWGRLAAASRFSWPRARGWLDRGRPLSLVALAALEACFRHDTPFLKHSAPTLEDPAPVEEMVAALDAYLVRDSVPNTRNRVQALRARWTRTESGA